MNLKNYRSKRRMESSKAIVGEEAKEERSVTRWAEQEWSRREGEFSGRFWPWRSFLVGRGTHNSIPYHFFPRCLHNARPMRGVQEGVCGTTRVAWTTLLPVEEQRMKEGERGAEGVARGARCQPLPDLSLYIPFHFFSLSATVSVSLSL